MLVQAWNQHVCCCKCAFDSHYCQTEIVCNGLLLLLTMERDSNERLLADPTGARVPTVSFAKSVAWNFIPHSNDTFFCKNCKQGNIKMFGSNGNLLKQCSRFACFAFPYRNIRDKGHNRDLQPMFKAYHAFMAKKQQDRAYFQAAVSPQAKKLCSWIELIVKCNLPLSVVENKIFCKQAGRRKLQDDTKVHHQTGRHRCADSS